MFQRLLLLLGASLLLVSCSEEQVVDALTLETGPQKFDGVWMFEFEGSTFIEDVEKAPPRRPPYETSAWLQYEPPVWPEGSGYDEKAGCYTVTAFKVDFIGTKKTPPLGAGHLGLWKSEFEVHEMIEITQIPGPDCQTYHAD
jgi:hypothetical protein